MLTPRLAHHDPDLARQLRRSSSAVALNVSEGQYALGRSRAAYNIALREMRESFAALEAAVRLRYLPPLLRRRRETRSADAHRGPCRPHAAERRAVTPPNQIPASDSLRDPQRLTLAHAVFRIQIVGARDRRDGYVEALGDLREGVAGGHRV